MFGLTDESANMPDKSPRYFFSNESDQAADADITLPDEFLKKYPPQTARAILGRDLPPDTKINITSFDNENYKLEVSSQELSDSRYFYPEKKLAWVGEIEAYKTGNGLGRKLMRNEIEFFSLCGIKEFNIYAGLAAGGYTWARFGFLPTAESLPALNDEIGSRYQAIRPLLAESEQEVFDKLTTLKKPQDIFTLVDTRVDIRPRLKKIFNAAAGTRELKEIIRTCDIQKGHLDKPKDYPLSRALLEGLNWDGILDMTNKEQMARVEKYVGGWNFIGRHRL